MSDESTTFTRDHTRAGLRLASELNDFLMTKVPDEPVGLGIAMIALISAASVYKSTYTDIYNTVEQLIQHLESMKQAYETAGD